MLLKKIDRLYLIITIGLFCCAGALIAGSLLAANTANQAESYIEFFGNKIKTINIGVALAFLAVILLVRVIGRIFKSVERLSSNKKSSIEDHPPISSKKSSIKPTTSPEVSQIDAELYLKSISQLEKPSIGRNAPLPESLNNLIKMSLKNGPKTSSQIAIEIGVTEKMAENLLINLSRKGIIASRDDLFMLDEEENF